MRNCPIFSAFSAQEKNYFVIHLSDQLRQTWVCPQFLIPVQAPRGCLHRSNFTRTLCDSSLRAFSASTSATEDYRDDGREYWFAKKRRTLAKNPAIGKFTSRLDKFKFGGHQKFHFWVKQTFDCYISAVSTPLIVRLEVEAQEGLFSRSWSSVFFGGAETQWYRCSDGSARFLLYFSYFHRHATKFHELYLYIFFFTEDFAEFRLQFPERFKIRTKSQKFGGQCIFRTSMRDWKKVKIVGAQKCWTI